jgi:hypothetical protein
MFGDFVTPTCGYRRLFSTSPGSMTSLFAPSAAPPQSSLHSNARIIRYFLLSFSGIRKNIRRKRLFRFSDAPSILCRSNGPQPRFLKETPQPMQFP